MKPSACKAGSHVGELGVYYLYHVKGTRSRLKLPSPVHLWKTYELSPITLSIESFYLLICFVPKSTYIVNRGVDGSAPLDTVQRRNMTARLCALSMKLQLLLLPVRLTARVDQRDESERA